jgi:arylsulfatase A-like enzyme
MHNLHTPLLLLWVAIASSSLAGETTAPPSATRPNIILIFADDLGWKDVGYQGSDFMETPNIDRLAREGMVFTAAYAAAANCAPSRACLLSGTYTPRHGVYAVGSTDRGDRNEQRLVPTPNKTGLAPDNFTLAKALKAAGYTTGIFGKWHLHGIDGSTPEQQGFDVVYQSQTDWSKGILKNPKAIYSLTQAACEFMEQNRARPFFIYLSHYAIHTNQEARASTLARFKAKTPGRQHHDPLYAACTYDLDDGVGRLLQKLKELGLEENTLVVFTSDNGGTQKSSQEPLRGNKGGYYEGGIREPFIARWPGVTRAGSSCDVPVINVDLFPTFLAAAGVSRPPDKILDGESLLPLLQGKNTLQRQSIFWHFPGYLNDPVIRGRDLDVRTGFRTRPVSVIHQGDWKLLLYHEEWMLDDNQTAVAHSPALELYNLREDIGEHHNLTDSRPDKRDALLADLTAWFAAVNAPIPSQPNPAYHTVPSGQTRKKVQSAIRDEPVGPEVRAVAFREKDLNHDGKLTAEEFTKGQADAEASRIDFERWDADQDGYLSRDEFINRN